jgi:colicin import membrane protein
MAEPLHPPRVTPKKITQPVKPVSTQRSEATDSYFAEQMAKLERSTEAKREQAVLEKLRNKIKAGDKSKAGAPGTMGTQSGSRYADYIKSRLEDALKVTNSYTTNNPEVAVRLTISPTGRLLRMQIERSSGDATFELAVRRAIDLAAEKFSAPPDRAVFENGFVFRPKSIASGTSP